MTAVDVDALAKLREAATPGPWAAAAGDGKVIRNVAVAMATAGRRPDAALIVAAVNALPDLIAAVRERDALRGAVVAIVDEMEDDESIGIPPNVPLLIAALRSVVDPS